MKIVSLLPSATEMVCLLGLQDQLVGVSADSDWPPEVVRRLPVLNTVSIDSRRLSSREIDAAATDGHRGASLYHVDGDLLRELRPDRFFDISVGSVASAEAGYVRLVFRGPYKVRPSRAITAAMWRARI